MSVLNKNRMELFRTDDSETFKSLLKKVLPKIDSNNEGEILYLIDLLMPSLKLGLECSFCEIQKVIDRSIPNEVHDTYMRRVNVYGMIMQSNEVAKKLSPEFIVYMASLGRPLFAVILKVLRYKAKESKEGEEAFVKMFEYAASELAKRNKEEYIYISNFVDYTTYLNKSPFDYLAVANQRVKKVILKLIAG